MTTRIESQPHSPLSRPYGTYPWVPDLGDGTYRNPVLLADYSDPDVVACGEDFYLTASSFHCTPGLPILQSRDLVNWRLIGHALRNLPDPRYREVQPGQGVWAPAIRYHDERFWIFFPTPDEGIFVVTAERPAGPWTEPHLVQAGRGLIDPCPLWDDDGRAYLVHAYAHSRSGIKHRLRVCPMAPDGSRLLGPGRVVFEAPDRHPTVEGPKFYRRDGWYYILAPAGGVSDGWQLALRSRSVYGPYEEKVVLEQGATQPTNGPHQGGLVETPDGQSWFVHFQDAGVYGRIVHLQPVRWRDGWPLMGEDLDGNGIGEPVLRFRKPGDARASDWTPLTSDEFVSVRLGRQWQWNANHERTWYSLMERPDHLRLFARPAPGPDLRLVPNLLLQKFPARRFRAETQVEITPGGPGEQAGLVVIGRRYASLGVCSEEGGARIVFWIDGEKICDEPASEEPLRIGVRVEDGGACRFYFLSSDGVERALGEEFQADAGWWIGARVGLYSIAPAGALASGHADFAYFRFGPPDPSPVHPSLSEENTQTEMMPQ